MYIMAVINMKNPNALIAMAQVAKNANNPYEAFCEYIKYCVCANVSDTMKLSEIKEAVGKEFGLYIPHNVLIKCLSYVQESGIITIDDHQIKRVGSFDTEAFDKEREAYRATEAAIIQSLMQYALKYSREWTTEYARELLIRVLDRSGLAYDIFLHGGSSVSDVEISSENESEILELLPDDEEKEPENDDNQPLFTDEYFVGKFVKEILAVDDVNKDYLQKICEGLMLCVGTYQVPSTNDSGIVTQIKGTSFFFDTKLLLRFLGCAGESAVLAARELVELIQKAGGKIYYYQQTLEEMERAFDKAFNSLSSGNPPFDDDMRLYAMQIQHDATIIKAKKASIVNELADKHIFLIPHDFFSDSDRIRFGFDKDDLQQYMRNNLPWDFQVIDNDALAIWETHMRRRGNYNEYFGTKSQLPVFVTTNSRLSIIALKYRENRPNTNSISGWMKNRLPVITDIRLTCRLWSPSEHSERLSLLYLTANAVAAKRPTKRYLNSIRELIPQLEKQVPQYAELCLPAYFDDTITDTVLEHIMGEDEKLDINNFANSIAELAEWKAKEQEEITKQVKTELSDVSEELKNQTQDIINSAVESGKKMLGWRKAALWLVVRWEFIVTIIFAAVAAGFSLIIGNWHPLWAILIPTIIKVVEVCSASNFIGRPLAGWLFPKIDKSINKLIAKNIRKAELPYKDTIIQQTKEQTKLWVECKKISKK